MYINIINKLNIAVNNKKKNLIIKNNKREKQILKIFIKLNLIKYIKSNNDTCYLRLNYINGNKLFKIVNFFKKSHIKILKLKNLRKIKLKNKIMLLSSNIGVINNFESLKKKRGGIIITLIWN